MTRESILRPFEWVMIIGTALAVIISAIFVTGLGNAVSDFDWWVTSIAAILNICCCTCSARGSRWTFFFGALYNIMYTYYCIVTAHYGNAAVYGLCFLPLQLVGWLHWRRIGNNEESSQVAAKRLSWKMRGLITLASAVVMVGLWLLLRNVGGHDSEVDAICTVLCVIAQLLLTFAFMEQWFVWIAVNVLTLVMWALSAAASVKAGHSLASDLNLVICYAFVLINSINGLRVWLALSKDRRM